MNTEVLTLAGIDIEIVQKQIKNLHIGVYPPDGRVRVAAPPSMSFDAVRVAILTRLPWIERKRLGFVLQQREGHRSYVSGETHWFWGRPLRLRVEPNLKGHSQLAVVGNDGLLMRVTPEADQTVRERLVLQWYRKELRTRAHLYVRKWSKVLSLPEPKFGVKRMRTKWGSCSPQTGRVWFNLSLAKKPMHCLDYVVLHEMAHFISARHDDALVDVLDHRMPSWRQTRAELNALPLDFWDTSDHPS